MCKKIILFFLPVSPKIRPLKTINFGFFCMAGWLVFYGTRSKKGHTVPDTRVKVKVLSAKEKIKKKTKKKSGWGFPIRKQ